MAEVRRRAKEEDERFMVEFGAKYPDEQDWSDMLAVKARLHRDHWESVWADPFGSFDDTTRIPPMRFTDQPAPSHARVQDTLQIFSVKIKETGRGLQWPLQVFGMVAARDPVDHNRNVIFNRERNNCQILTQEDPVLKLTGPTRAVVVCDPVYFEVELKVKGFVEAEDKDLSLLAVALTDYSSIYSTCLISKAYTSKLSTLELKFGYVLSSVEATISVCVTEGSWPDDVFGRYTAQTSSLEDMPVLLLEFEKIPVDDDGRIKLSRRVASVEFEGELKVYVSAFRYDKDLDKIIMVGEDEKGFRPKKAGKSSSTLDVGFCKMDVTVAWSILSLSP
ncbi:uncharacterized protein LOC8071407 [Sorghum bicolor]|uniref:DUF6598 domain-containing protein n=1 Tax=Sorghum bicolor TaxID=4558 RepID=A0A1B6PAK2_SORBI|nr:uncharacterized protein LOC8071407 [Sorghum bicolor]XP_021302007.1 uncharacterized protein LOC8071407 [Sorghum bicolor]XP_021302008.1 uncharacterized protein LOC8071407 [Sorghum bicolor]KXG22819.1 hypothetical protein SORBI_3008G012100 [Sorghum bicolor]|eukprot:XP_021302006.1 uncharacterized protein LOC8071407 [Sorghum bicolor]